MSNSILNQNYDPALGAELVTLATLANKSLSSLFVPGWDLLFKYTSSSMYGSCQYYLAMKTYDSQAVCAVVTGALWRSFISFYTPQDNHIFTSLGSNIVGSKAVNAFTHQLRLQQVQDDLKDISQTLAKIDNPDGGEKLNQAALALQSRCDQLSQLAPNDPQWQSFHQRTAGLVSTLQDLAKSPQGGDMAKIGDAIRCHQSDLSQLRQGIRSTSQDAEIDTGFSLMYRAIRGSLLDDLQKVKQQIPAFQTTMPVICAGLGPGGPIAQLASLDLRPGNGNSPATSIQAYAYSCPAYGNGDYQSLYNSAVTASFRVQAQADLFPSLPDQTTGYVQVGTEESLPLDIRTYDSPWVERDGPYYNELLTQSDPGSGEPGTVSSVTGFSQALAFALGQLCAVAYQMFQHPGSTPSFSYTPYDLKQNLTLNGAVWASVFEGPDNLVLALRGTVSWLELMTIVSDSFPGYPSWLPTSFGSYAKSLVDLYASGRDTVRQALNGLVNKPVLVTGHGSGGALANLIAVDLDQNPLTDQRSLAAVYTFGATPAATPIFATQYDTILAGRNYQVARPQDIMPNLPLLGFFVPQGQLVTLSGGSFNPYNGATFHGLLTYLALLNTGN
ncbi:MAG: hypothetical protein F6J94_05675 [Moorea sp. SIO1F2]|uniref:lipase family protein n=1 Tax=Moorena sp. SIO1F2 TaxID=2607819 RepID=UPI0013BCE254|nr:hypothetical protein [Moorena sp. SIO1F2]NET81458.1 hypothetical protein [Moorena sp. SIO1F2]